MDALIDNVEEQLRSRGLAHVAGPLAGPEYEALARQIGEIVGEERIALRPGAHAYVAKPGPVPLHTDHPDVDVLAWFCEEQDTDDGASRLFDAKRFLDRLLPEDRHMLRAIELWCPPLSGGPPTERRPVLRAVDEGDALFCPPWVRSANDDPSHVTAIETFRAQLSTEIQQSTIEIRLAPGDALFIDNQRVLHGRGAISETSTRTLHRRWIRRSGAAQTRRG